MSSLVNNSFSFPLLFFSEYHCGVVVSFIFNMWNPLPSLLFMLPSMKKYSLWKVSEVSDNSRSLLQTEHRISKILKSAQRRLDFKAFVCFYSHWFMFEYFFLLSSNSWFISVFPFGKGTCPTLANVHPDSTILGKPPGGRGFQCGSGKAGYF